MSKKTSKAQAEAALKEMIPFLPNSLNKDEIEVLEKNGNWNIYLNSSDARLRESFHKVYKEVRVFLGSRDDEDEEQKMKILNEQEELATAEEELATAEEEPVKTKRRSAKSKKTKASK